MDNHKVMKDHTGKEIVEQLRQLRTAIVTHEEVGKVYGFHVDSSESDPTACVTYLGDAVGMTPAYMDYTNGKFVWGSWEDAFFIPRPCMLKSDGTVDYYLMEYDYGRKLDGTTSDVANTSYDGNAMMEWGQNGKIIWYKVVPDENDNTSFSVYIADAQVDEGYVCWSFVNGGGDIVDHFYTPIYNGTIVNDGTNDVLRSLSGVSWSSYGCKGKNASTERTMAQRNGTNWDTEVYADVILINLLLTLMGKSLSSQTVFGQGLCDSGSDSVNNGFTTGVHNTKGLFWGTNSGAASTYANAVKIFGMENWWGFQWRRFCGLVNVSGTMKYKLTKGTDDGSTATDYVVSTSANDYSGYLTGDTLPAASGTYIKTQKWKADGAYTPTDASGDSTKYYCDGLWTNNNQVDYAYRGGDSSGSARVGAWCLALDYASSHTRWYVGASPSYKSQS